MAIAERDAQMAADIISLQTEDMRVRQDMLICRETIAEIKAKAFAEVRRVLRPSGAIAVCTYGRHYVDGVPQATAIVEDFHDNVVGPYWPPGREHVDSNYDDLPFPFRPIDVPAVRMECLWSLEQLLDYLGTWSATSRYEAALGRDPRELIASDLAAAWGDPATVRRIVWPLTVLAGRV